MYEIMARRRLAEITEETRRKLVARCQGCGCPSTFRPIVAGLCPDCRREAPAQP